MTRSHALLVVALLVFGVSAPVDAQPPGGLLRLAAPLNFIEGEDFAGFANPVPVGTAVAPVSPVAYGALESGCDPSHFSNFPPGDIALISRGTCNFFVKVLNAQDAGATGVLIANNVPGVSNFSLSNAAGIEIPALPISMELGDAYAALIPNGLAVFILVRRPSP